MSISAAETTPKKVVLQSPDRDLFEVEEAVILESQTIKRITEGACVDEAIPLPNVKSPILVKIIEYCKKHVFNEEEGKNNADELKKFDVEFVEVDEVNLYDMICAANYLNMKGLLDLICQKVVDMKKGRTVEEIRTIFNIENDYTPEEEEALRRENAWAFE